VVAMSERGRMRKSDEKLMMVFFLGIHGIFFCGTTKKIEDFYENSKII
jgi:hypothetical protein